jgi:hypothetical protein
MDAVLTIQLIQRSRMLTPKPLYMKMKYLFTILVPAILLVLSSCRKEKEIPEVAVNPEFEMNPPLAKDVSIQKVDEKEGNLLVIADFGPGVIKSPYHAVQLSTGKVTLRDDGFGADEKAEDGKFSVFIKEDLSILNEEISRLEKNKDRLMKEVSFDFKGRHVVKRDSGDFLKLDFRDFNQGKRISIPPGLICRLFLDVSIPHSLLVTKVETVEDPLRTRHPCTGVGAANGAWTFEKLVTDMANPAVTGITAQDFVKDWLETWLIGANVNTEPVAERTELFNRVIRPWLIQSGSPAATFNITTWKTKTLNLSKAPFKLISIVNRLDLRGNMGYGISNAGEGRFVFEVLDPGTCVPLPEKFTVIFEYGIPIHSCEALKAYGQKWYDLKNNPVGGDVYNTALQQLTDVFAAANADNARPNGSSLNQIRTNERVIGSPWELREFIIDATTHKLVLTTVKQEPAEKYNEVAFTPGTPADVAKLVIWVNDNAPAILNDKHVVPVALPTAEPFLGGKAHSEPGLWQAVGISDAEVRHHFSFNTCSGCHKAETNAPFVHLSVVPYGTESVPSGFMAGISANDPISGTPHDFNDLANRQTRLEDLLCNGCAKGFRELVAHLTFNPIRMPH